MYRFCGPHGNHSYDATAHRVSKRSLHTCKQFTVTFRQIFDTSWTEKDKHFVSRMEDTVLKENNHTLAT